MESLFDGLEFAPRVAERDARAPRMLLHRCPFIDVACEHQDVVCALHLCVLRGALSELGATHVATAIHPLVEPQLLRR